MLMARMRNASNTKDAVELIITRAPRTARPARRPACGRTAIALLRPGAPVSTDEAWPRLVGEAESKAPTLSGIGTTERRTRKRGRARACGQTAAQRLRATYQAFTALSCLALPLGVYDCTQSYS